MLAVTADAELAERIARMRRGVSSLDAAGDLTPDALRVSAALRPALVAFTDALETTMAATMTRDAACDAAEPGESESYAVRLLGVYDAVEAKVANAAEQFAHAAELANAAEAVALVALAVAYTLDARACCEAIRANSHRLAAILASARDGYA